MPLDRQLDSVRMPLEEQNARSCEDQSHTANHVQLRGDSDSDMEEEDWVSNFEYHVSHAGMQVAAARQNQKGQEKQMERGDARPPAAGILDQKAKITKERIQKEKGLATPKTMRFGTWGRPLIGNPGPLPGPSAQPPEDLSADELMGDAESDASESSDTIQVGGPVGNTAKRVRFTAKNKGKEKDRAGDQVKKFKNIRLSDMLKRMAEENPGQVVQKLLRAVVPDITVEDILTSGSVAHKLMFKPANPGVIEKIQVNAAKTMHLENV